MNESLQYTVEQIYTLYTQKKITYEEWWEWTQTIVKIHQLINNLNT